MAISMLTSRQAADILFCAAPSFINSASRVMLHRRQFLQPRPQPLLPSAVHAAFLGDTIPTDCGVGGTHFGGHATCAL